MRLVVPGLSWWFCADNHHFLVGDLPKELGDLINLKSFDVSYNSIGGQLSIRPTTWNLHLTRRAFLRSFERREGRLAGETSQLPHVLLRREAGMVVLDLLFYRV